MSLELKRSFLKHLTTLGWVPVDDTSLECTTSLASKPYDTIVGKKVASLYVASFGDEFKVHGDYYSEGRNVIYHEAAYIMADADPECVEHALTDLNDQIDKAVSLTYAMRLKRKD